MSQNKPPYETYTPDEREPESKDDINRQLGSVSAKMILEQGRGELLNEGRVAVDRDGNRLSLRDTLNITNSELVAAFARGEGLSSAEDGEGSESDGPEQEAGGSEFDVTPEAFNALVNEVKEARSEIAELKKLVQDGFAGSAAESAPTEDEASAKTASGASAGAAAIGGSAATTTATKTAESSAATPDDVAKKLKRRRPGEDDLSAVKTGEESGLEDEPVSGTDEADDEKEPVKDPESGVQNERRRQELLQKIKEKDELIKDLEENGVSGSDPESYTTRVALEDHRRIRDAYAAELANLESAAPAEDGKPASADEPPASAEGETGTATAESEAGEEGGEEPGKEDEVEPTLDDRYTKLSQLDNEISDLNKKIGKLEFGELEDETLNIEDLKKELEEMYGKRQDLFDELSREAVTENMKKGEAKDDNAELEEEKTEKEKQLDSLADQIATLRAKRFKLLRPELQDQLASLETEYQDLAREMGRELVDGFEGDEAARQSMFAAWQVAAWRDINARTAEKRGQTRYGKLVERLGKMHPAARMAIMAGVGITVGVGAAAAGVVAGGVGGFALFTGAATVGARAARAKMSFDASQSESNKSRERNGFDKAMQKFGNVTGLARLTKWSQRRLDAKHDRLLKEETDHINANEKYSDDEKAAAIGRLTAENDANRETARSRRAMALSIGALGVGATVGVIAHEVISGADEIAASSGEQDFSLDAWEKQPGDPIDLNGVNTGIGEAQNIDEQSVMGSMSEEVWNGRSDTFEFTDVDGNELLLQPTEIEGVGVTYDGVEYDLFSGREAWGSYEPINPKDAWAVSNPIEGETGSEAMQSLESKMITEKAVLAETVSGMQGLPGFELDNGMSGDEILEALKSGEIDHRELYQGVTEYFESKDITLEPGKYSGGYITTSMTDLDGDGTRDLFNWLIYREETDVLYLTSSDPEMQAHLDGVFYRVECGQFGIAEGKPVPGDWADRPTIPKEPAPPVAPPAAPPESPVAPPVTPEIPDEPEEEIVVDIPDEPEEEIVVDIPDEEGPQPEPEPEEPVEEEYLEPKKPEEDINASPDLPEELKMGDDRVGSGELQQEHEVTQPKETYAPPAPEPDPAPAPEATPVAPEIRQEEVAQAPGVGESSGGGGSKDNPANSEIDPNVAKDLAESGAGELDTNEDGDPVGNDGRVDG